MSTKPQNSMSRVYDCISNSILFVVHPGILCMFWISQLPGPGVVYNDSYTTVYDFVLFGEYDVTDSVQLRLNKRTHKSSTEAKLGQRVRLQYTAFLHTPGRNSRRRSTAYCTLLLPGGAESLQGMCRSCPCIRICSGTLPRESGSVVTVVAWCHLRL